MVVSQCHTILCKTNCWLAGGVARFAISLQARSFLPRDAMRKRGLCCRPVSVRPSVRPSVRLSVCLSRWYIVSRWLKISSNLFLGPVTHHSSFLTPSIGTKFQGEPFQQGRKIHRVKNFANVEIAIYLENSTR